MAVNRACFQPPWPGGSGPVWRWQKPILRSLDSSELLSHCPLVRQASGGYFLQPSMLKCLIVGDVKGAELDLIPHACDNTPTCVYYLGNPIVDVQLESTRPKEQHRLRDAGVVANSDPQAFSIEDQFPDVALRPPACRQRLILPGEVDFNVRKDFDLLNNDSPPTGR